MPVNSVKERWEGRGATTNEKGIRTLKRQWLVETESDDTGEPEVIDAVIAADASAELYASHPHWSPALCRDLTAAPFGGPRQWLVDAAYSSAPFEAFGDASEDGDDTQPNASQSNSTPANARPPKITITRKEKTVPLEFDAVEVDGDGNPLPVTNGIGDPFIPPPEVFRSNHLITYKFHRLPSELNWATRSLFMDKINSTPWVVFGRTYEEHSLRVVDYALDTEWETGPSGGMRLFFALTVQLEYNPDLWDVVLLNRGRRTRKQVGSMGDVDNPLRWVYEWIMDETGQPVSEPVPLDADGQVIPPSAPGDPPPEYTYMEYNGYVPVSFANLLA